MRPSSPSTATRSAPSRVPSELAIVPGATHLFEEPGALEDVAGRAADWFADHLHAIAALATWARTPRSARHVRRSAASSSRREAGEDHLKRRFRDAVPQHASVSALLHAHLLADCLPFPKAAGSPVEHDFDHERPPTPSDGAVGARGRPASGFATVLRQPALRVGDRERPRADNRTSIARHAIAVVVRELSGGGGIRTHGTCERSTVFKTVAFDLSATPPGRAASGANDSRPAVTRTRRYG